MMMIGMMLFSMMISAQTSWQSINRYAEGLTENSFVLALGLNDKSLLKSDTSSVINVAKFTIENDTSILVDFEEGEISPFYWQHIGVPWHISD